MTRPLRAAYNGVEVNAVLFFYDCDAGFVPDSGEPPMTNGSVENFPLDWDTGEPTEQNEQNQE